MDYRLETMLSRHASSLFWLGRYQERAEYLARFLQVKYFSTLDNSIPEYSDIVLRSVLFMFTGKVPKNKIYDQSDVLMEVSLDTTSQTSILTYVNIVRENTKGVRNLVSNELWESVNKNYHFVNSFDIEYLKTRGLYEFTNGVQENAVSFHTKLDSTMLHDNTRAFIKLGIYVERAYQVTKAMINTLIDIKALNNTNENVKVENHQWVLMLKVLEAADMSRKILNNNNDTDSTCEFLITNTNFPKSLSFCFSKINDLLRKIKNSSDQAILDKNSIEFKSAKLTSHLKYLDYNEIGQSLDVFLDSMLEEIFKLNNLIHEDFFGYED